MKKDIIQTLKILLAAAVLSMGISYVYAWTAPPQAPPAGNTPAPLDAGGTPQKKVGALSINDTTPPTNSISHALEVYGTSLFGAKANFLDDIVLKNNTSGIEFPDGTKQTTAVKSVPSGAVSAFNLSSCPSGWSSFTSARNRTIIGSGGSYGLRTTGGASTVTLTVAQMPAHNHNFSKRAAISMGSRGSIGGGDGNLNTRITFNTSTTGGNQPHNNMQPYIALLYCVKN